MHTLYAQAALGIQSEEHLNLSAFFFRVVNNVFLYILYIILGGIIVANLRGEYALELLTVEEPGDTSTQVKGKRRKAKKEDSTKKDLIFWFISWMPEKWINRLTSNADDEDDIG